MSSFDPLGFRPDGRPFWGFSGGDGEDDGDGSDQDGDTGDGDDGEKNPVKVLESTLTKVRQERKAVQDEYRPYKAALRELGIQSPEQLKELLTKGSGAGASGDSGKQIQQADLDKVRADAKAEATLESNRELALAKVEAQAKGLFADPDDAVDHLRKHVDDLLGRDGKPDKSAIKRELDDLLAAKPHWGVGDKEDITFDGGARQSGGKTTGMDGFLRQVSRAKRGQ